ncbi:MAG TPA: hypothetical protein VEV17_20210 [Bryobacteraceae bacterium]|nr:hypothetical protein [Bryobacteraceae bacterium]
MPTDTVLTADKPSGFVPHTVNAAHCLFPPCLERKDGAGPATDVDDLRGKLAVVRMGINHVAEREWLAVSIWGSVDGYEWGVKPLVTLPRKGYCGVYSMFLDLSKHPEVRYLQARWTMGRSCSADGIPVFGFSVSLQAAA